MTFTLVRYLESFEMAVFLGVLEGKQATLERSPGNEALLKAFLFKRRIMEYNVDEQGDPCFKLRERLFLGEKL